MTETQDAYCQWRKANQKVIRRALALLAPENRTECEDLLATEMIELWYLNNLHGKFPSAEKKAAARMEITIRRLEIAALDDDLSSALRLFFPSEVLNKFAEQARMEATRRLPRAASLKPANSRRRAIRAAHRLWRRYASRSLSLRKGSPFCKLAALLSGDPEADLSRQAKAALSTKVR